MSHELIEGGCAVIDKNGEPLGWPYAENIGRALCSCGAKSEVLWRNRQRIAWFHSHVRESAALQKAVAS